jgi:SH3-like domain-containing protein
LVADQAGREGWIQQRWLRADGTVSTATFEKAVANTAERQAQRKGLFRFLSSGAK